MIFDAEDLRGIHFLQEEAALYARGWPQQLVSRHAIRRQRLRMGLILSRLSAISKASPHSTRVNEDAYYFCGRNDDFYLLVIDGAATRVRTATIDRLAKSYRNDATAASYAAELTRGTIAAMISSSLVNDVRPSLASLLLAANSALNAQLKQVLLEVTSDGVLRVESHLGILREDPRLIRLVLPVCVATIAYVDLTTSTLRFAHAGDTALFIKYVDGSLVRVTTDNMEVHERQALGIARSSRQSNQRVHISDLIGDEEIESLNRRNGLYHNYVDERGKTNSSIGVGVINGLPELTHYIQEDSLELNDVQGLLACTDGFIWPSAWDESEEQRVARLQRMWQSVARDGLASYVMSLRAIEATDPHLDNYPRFKLHDDATAIYTELIHE